MTDRPPTSGAARLRGVLLGDPSDALARLGLGVDDEGRTVVGGVTLVAAGDQAGRGILGLDVEGVTPGVLPAASIGATPDAVVHPLGAVAVDHVVVLTGDVRGTVAALGVEAARTEDRGDRTYAYVVAGTALLELVGPSSPDDRPPRPWGLALAVADLDAAAALLGDACGEVRPAVQPGRRIATVRHEQLGLSVPTVLLTERVR